MIIGCKLEEVSFNNWVIGEQEGREVLEDTELEKNWWKEIVTKMSTRLGDLQKVYLIDISEVEFEERDMNGVKIFQYSQGDRL